MAKPFETERDILDAVAKDSRLTARYSAGAMRAAGADVLRPVTSPLERLRAIRDVAWFALVQESLSDACTAEADALGHDLSAREVKLGFADAYFAEHLKAVARLITLIVGDDEAIAQLDMIELHCGALGG